MDQPFKIKFDFPLANSELTVSLKATVQLHRSDPYYLVQDFYFDEHLLEKNYRSVLPPQEIKSMWKAGSKVWVHRDSERETLLSIRLGEAIEVALKQI